MIETVQAYMVEINSFLNHFNLEVLKLVPWTYVQRLNFQLRFSIPQLYLYVNIIIYSFKTIANAY